MCKVLIGDIDFEAEVPKQLPFHLVDFPEREESLTDDGPALVAVGIIAAALASEHERRNEQPVTTGSTGSREARLEALEQEECLVRDGERQACAM